MTPRDTQGRFVREVTPPPPDVFGAPDREGHTVGVDLGRGQMVSVAVGSPFVDTVERLAREAHYGGYFRVFLNGSELTDPADSPATIQAGARIAITSYDKVG